MSGASQKNPDHWDCWLLCCIHFPPNTYHGMAHTGSQKPAFILSIQDGNNSFSGLLQELDFRPKNCILGPKKEHFCLSEPKNCLPNGRTASHQRSEGIQSYLRIWGWHDPIKLTISETNKWGSCGCSVKKSRFLGKKWAQIGHGGCLKALHAKLSTQKSCSFNVQSCCYKTFGECL